MRLINAETIQLEEFTDNEVPVIYAILSHTWGKDEVSYSDMKSPHAALKSGYRKIEYACQEASWNGISHVWVDTCCIDKSSSAELSEAINSMFRW